MHTLKLIAISSLAFLATECLGQEATTNLQTQTLAQALESKDWQLIYHNTRKASGQDTIDCNTPAVIRFLHGHAALATGAHNSAMKAFYCSCDSTDSNTLAVWENWTQQQVSNSKDTSTSSNFYYLYADALARNNKPFEAHNAFSKAIELKANNALALNARGVNRWITVKAVGASSCRECTEDWKDALRADSTLADAHTNLGVAQMLVGGNQERCITYFTKAIDVDPEFALAHNAHKVALHSIAPNHFYADYSHKYADIIGQTPFSILDSEAIAEVIGARGALSQMNFEMGAVKVGGGTLVDAFEGVARGGSNILDASIDKYMYGTNMIDNPKTYNGLKEVGNAIRGGVYSYQNESNTTTHENTKISVAATWFLLNYPLKKLSIPQKN